MNEGRFKPRARLLVQLGDQLIRSENIAIVELIKNAYDADASECDVVCEYINDAEKGKIIIQDNGIGMSPEVVKNVWLEPGADFKKQILENGNQATFDFSDKVELPKRTPLGEKGVGRFGAHKLGNKIELVTKNSRSDKEVVINIDWEKFADSKYLEDAVFPIEERNPEVFKGKKTGTRISVSGLRYEWDENGYQELTRNINSLKSPFQGHDTFDVKQKLILGDKKEVSKWQSSKIDSEDIRNAALWEVRCTIEGNRIIDFLMTFKPWTGLGLESRTFTLDDLKKDNSDLLKGVLSDNRTTKNLNLLSAGIGRVEFMAYVYDLDRRTLEFNPLESKELRKYLSDNGGVRVYRDNFRIYDYGEPGNDWLNLDNARINNPSQKIGNKNIVGAVLLDRRTSAALVEKTNREGFVENRSYKVFMEAIQYAVKIVGRETGHDKGNIRTKEKTASKPVVGSVGSELFDLRDKVVDRLSNVDMKNKDVFIKDINEDFERIQDQYVKTSEVLIKSSNMGLTFGVVVHEVDKRLNRVKYLLEHDEDDLDAKELKAEINGIVQLVEGYAAISATDKKNNSLKKTLDIALLNTEFRFKAHKIEVIKAYEDVDDSKAKFSLNSIVGVLLNIFDNSIHWLEQYQVKNSKIYVQVKHYKDSVGIVVADNGKGFGIAFEDAVKPYVTQKVIGGHGLGLHIASEVMRVQKGNLRQLQASELPDLPKEFEDGAIVELLFKV